MLSHGPANSLDYGERNSVTGNGETVATVMRGVVHDIAGRKADSEQDNEAKHRGEKRIELARLRNLGARIGDSMILGIDGLRAHELYPLRGVGANAEL